MFMTSGVLLVLARTGSAPLAGVTAAASVVPGALTGPVLGAWLDVARRRRLLVVLDQLLSVAALVAILVLAGHAPDWTVPAAAVLYGVTRPLSSGSFFSALAEIAGADLLDQASAVEATSLNVAVIIGPALAGVLAGAVGAARTVEVQIVLTLIVAVLIAINAAFEARPPQRAESLGHAAARRLAGAGPDPRPARHRCLGQPGRLRMGPDVGRLSALCRPQPARSRARQRLSVGGGGRRVDPRHVRAARGAVPAPGRALLRRARSVGAAVAAGGDPACRLPAHPRHGLSRRARVLGNDRPAPAQRAAGRPGPGDDHRQSALDRWRWPPGALWAASSRIR